MNRRAREPEFYANSTLGFRQWSLSLEATGEPALKATVRHGFHLPRYRWNLQGPNPAECPRLKLGPGSFHGRHGAIPAPECSCGFYAHGRRDGSGSESTLHTVGGVVAGWGNLELHERGFRCSTAKILALFTPDPDGRDDDDGLARRKWAALIELCADNSIPLLTHDALRGEEEVRRYAAERDLALLEDQLRTARAPWPALEAIGGEEELAS